MPCMQGLSVCCIRRLRHCFRCLCRLLSGLMTIMAKMVAKTAKTVAKTANLIGGAGAVVQHKSGDRAKGRLWGGAVVAGHGSPTSRVCLCIMVHPVLPSAVVCIKEEKGRSGTQDSGNGGNRIRQQIHRAVFCRSGRTSGGAEPQYERAVGRRRGHRSRSACVGERAERPAFRRGDRRDRLQRAGCG